MTETTTQQNTETKASTEATATVRTPSSRTPRPRSSGPGTRAPGRGPARGGARGSSRGGRGGFDRVKPEFDNKIIQIRRVTRVVSGGRRFTFSVALVAGNRKGSVAVGVGKAADTAAAIEKATKNAKKNMIKIDRKSVV